jgi:hypothetical protein
MSQRTSKFIGGCFLATVVTVFAWGLLCAQVAAQNTGQTTTTVTTQTTTASGASAIASVDAAQNSVDASMRDHIVSVYGVGTPSAISTWWVIFYDPSVPSHGRAVKVDNGQVTKTYEAKGGVVYADTLTFTRAQVADQGAALGAAQNYAAQNSLAYDNVRALLRKTTADQTLRWRIQMLNGATNKGFVFVNAADGSFAMYSPPGSVPTKGTSASATGGGVVGDVQHVGNEVKNTFLGIGGDLQEFFTGERTVDR